MLSAFDAGGEWDGFFTLDFRTDGGTLTLAKPQGNEALKYVPSFGDERWVVAVDIAGIKGEGVFDSDTIVSIASWSAAQSLAAKYNLTTLIDQPDVMYLISESCEPFDVPFTFGPSKISLTKEVVLLKTNMGCVLSIIGFNGLTDKEWVLGE